MGFLKDFFSLYRPEGRERNDKLVHFVSAEFSLDSDCVPVFASVWNHSRSPGRFLFKFEAGYGDRRVAVSFCAFWDEVQWMNDVFEKIRVLHPSVDMSDVRYGVEDFATAQDEWSERKDDLEKLGDPTCTRHPTDQVWVFEGESGTKMKELVRRWTQY